MMVLGWMRKTFMGNINEPSKIVMTGRSYSCSSAPPQLGEQQHYPKPEYSCIHFRKPRMRPESSIAVKSNRVEEVNEEGSTDMGSDFHGFLAIGTLGPEPFTMDPLTPKFATPSERVTLEGTEATEDELKSLSNKLEKLNENDIEEVSKEGSSLAHPNKEIKGIDTTSSKNMVISPLQEYSLRTTSEMPLAEEEVRMKKKSPYELFKKNSKCYKHHQGKLDEAEQRGPHAFRSMKKLLKKLQITSWCSPTSANNNATDSDSAKRKLPKVHRRSRKIHPDTAGLNVTKSHKYEVKNSSYDEGYCHEDIKVEAEDNNMSPHTGMLKKEIACCRSLPKGDSQSNGITTYWIKTDADYLVLEF